MSARPAARTAVLWITAAALAGSTMLGACVTTPGAPADDESGYDYGDENPAQALEEEADEQDWEDANR